MPTLAEVFSPTGDLFARLPGFTYREAQQQMAELVWQALNEGSHAVLEAGTGIGKTYAYLIPVLLSGRRAIISTGTKTLQDQVFRRDLPSLGGVLGRPVEVALLKGRNNYLCWQRLETAQLDGRRNSKLKHTFEALSAWGHASDSGDLTELDDLSEEHGLRGLVTSTVDNCLGNQCEHFDQCFVVEARRRAQDAQVVIVNHHLLLADLALKEAGFGELLPGADVVIVDEAHQFPEIAQQFFGTSITSRELELLLRDTIAEGRSAGMTEEIQDVTGDLMRTITDAYLRSGNIPGRFAWRAGPPEFLSCLVDLQGALTALADALAHAADARAGLARCGERGREAARKLKQIIEDESEDGLRWLELSGKSFGAHSTPVDIGAALAERIADQAGTWVFTSATLAIRDDFTHFLARIGIDDAISCALPSPFDYMNNARLYVPQGLPEPRHPDHVASFMAAVWPLIETAGGGAFLLFTSYRALHSAEEWLAPYRPQGPVLVQGSGSRSQLLEQFRDAGDGILLGTGSFWQGVDVRGPALRIVAIDKLPFAAPNDPLIQARVESIRRNGGDPFNEFQLPQAVLALKQGVGRLIRDFDDRGLIVLGDARLRTKPYGRVFIDSLPPMPLLEEPAEALEFAATLRPGNQDRLEGF